MDRWIIAKHVNASFNSNKRWGLDDSIYGTYTADQLKIPRAFGSKEEAEKFLKQACELNPSMGYGVVKVTR